MFVVSSLIALGVVILLILANWHRGQKSYKYDLVSNCLLTKYPIVFINGKKSLFYFYRYWNLLPDFLRDHGYEVMEVDLPWRDVNKRQQRLQDFFRICNQTGLKVHVIVDESSQEELTSIRRHALNVIQSFTLVSHESKPESLDWVQEINVAPLKLMASLLQRTFVLLHNLWVFSPTPLQPATVGMTKLSGLSPLAGRFLQHAISLAESDAKCSH